MMLKNHEHEQWPWAKAALIRNGWRAKDAKEMIFLTKKWAIWVLLYLKRFLPYANAIKQHHWKTCISCKPGPTLGWRLDPNPTQKKFSPTQTQTQKNPFFLVFSGTAKNYFLGNFLKSKGIWVNYECFSGKVGVYQATSTLFTLFRWRSAAISSLIS